MSDCSCGHHQALETLAARCDYAEGEAASHVTTIEQMAQSIAALKTKLEQAEAALLALVEKIEKVEPKLAGVTQMAFVHGMDWPPGDEWNWAHEMADARAALLKATGLK